MTRNHVRVRNHQAMIVLYLRCTTQTVYQVNEFEFHFASSFLLEDVYLIFTRSYNVMLISDVFSLSVCVISDDLLKIISQRRKKKKTMSK